MAKLNFHIGDRSTEPPDWAFPTDDAEDAGTVEIVIVPHGRHLGEGFTIIDPPPEPEVIPDNDNDTEEGTVVVIKQPDRPVSIEDEIQRYEAKRAARIEAEKREVQAREEAREQLILDIAAKMTRPPDGRI